MKSVFRFVFPVCVAASALVPLSYAAPVAAEEEAKNDPRAEKLLNDFLTALQSNSSDMDAAIKAAVPHLHKSLLSKNDPSDVSPDLRRFSFKKAWQGAGFYSNPVTITRRRPTSISAIGFGPTAEKGSVVDYFIAKKSGVNGMPAPVKIFFPADGGAPKISYIGSI